MDQTSLRKEILAFLRENFIMSAAVSENDKPSATILLYHVDDEFNFYFATHTNTYKTRKLLNNPAISLCVWQHNQMLIQVDGTASEVSDPSQKLAIIDKLAESAAKGPDFWPPLLRIGGEAYIVFKVTPHWLRKLDLKQDTMTQVDSPFEEITF